VDNTYLQHRLCIGAACGGASSPPLAMGRAQGGHRFDVIAMQRKTGIIGLVDPNLP
jgi:hypothetical protein